MRARMHSIVDYVGVTPLEQPAEPRALSAREQDQLAEIAALLAFRSTVGDALRDLVSKPITTETWRAYGKVHAIATRTYRSHTAAAREERTKALTDVAHDYRDAWRLGQLEIS